MSTNILSLKEQDIILTILQFRFEKNMNRHKGIAWTNVKDKLVANPEKLWSLNEMERTGGEPDLIISMDKRKKSLGTFIFYDCAEESPKGRRSICYDDEALKSRKEHKPVNSAINMAIAMGIEILTEDEYRVLQTFGNFDMKTSSWVKTPAEIRKLGGAIFCDRRYNHVFMSHNGAESYYAARGFRGKLVV